MSDTPASAAPPARFQGWSLRLLAPASWLSGRLSFSRKYLLVGTVMLLAMALLCWPLLRQTREDAERVGLEQRGLAIYLQQVDRLAEMLDARARDMRHTGGAPAARPTPVGSKQAKQATDKLAPAQARLDQQLQQLQSLAPDEDPQRRFAAHTAAINALLTLMRDSARLHQLHSDLALDSAFDMLTLRLPLLMETLAKQQDALVLSSDSMASYALGAQVVLSESAPALRAGMAQLLQDPTAGSTSLAPQLDALLQSIERQQDAVDKLADVPDARAELLQLARSNQQDTLALIQGATAHAQARLQTRQDGLVRAQWQVAALLLASVSAIAYLFAGIYVSTLRSLKRLSQGTEAFCAGKLNTRIQVDTQDELVLVSRNFNTVADEVGRLLDVIREQNESRQRELERLVQVRTLELADKNAQLQTAALRVQDELASARDMQQAILPQQFPNTALFSMHACMNPARELGGDFYDCFALPGGRWGFLVADVAGKGVGAAFFMAVSRTVLQDLALADLSPSEVFARANTVLAGRNPMELFVTACFGIYTPASGQLVYASAGHPAPLLRKASGEVSALPCTFDVALGVLPDLGYSEQQAHLSPGDTLLLYTDGMTEAFDAAQQAYGDARLHARLATCPAEQAQAVLQALVDDVSAFVGGAEASDDLTGLVLCRKSAAEATSAEATRRTDTATQPTTSCKPGKPERADPSTPPPNSPPHTPPDPPTPILAMLPDHAPAPVLKNKTLLLDFRLASRVEEIAGLAEAVDKALQERADLAFAINLCLEELITNTIQHGLHGAPDRQIQVRLSRSDEWLEIIIKDDAPPFDPFVEAPAPTLDAELDERAIGGLGVHMVRTMMDEVRAYYDGSGNLIVLLKTLKQ